MAQLNKLSEENVELVEERIKKERMLLDDARIGSKCTLFKKGREVRTECNLLSNVAAWDVAVHSLFSGEGHQCVRQFVRRITARLAT